MQQPCYLLLLFTLFDVIKVGSGRNEFNKALNQIRTSVNIRLNKRFVFCPFQIMKARYEKSIPNRFEMKIQQFIILFEQITLKRPEGCAEVLEPVGESP